MSRSRKTKAIKAAKKGADYALAGAGVTSLSLTTLGLCVTLSNPIALAIAGSVGAIACCLGCGVECSEPDEDKSDRIITMEHKLEDKLIEIEDRIDYAMTHPANDPGYLSHGRSPGFYQSAPNDMVMDDDEKSQDVIKVKSLR